MDFLRLLDDPRERRSHVIFLTHGALHRALSDHWVRLALIQRAFKGRSSLRSQRENFGRFAGKILRVDGKFEGRGEGILGRLLERPSETWLKYLHQAHPDFVRLVHDDPIPKDVQLVLDEIDSGQLEPLVEALRQLPLRSSLNLDERLTEVRRVLASEMRILWGIVLKRASFTSPLLILDEAHHLKNPETRIASLFIEEEANEEADAVSAGPLAGKFDRMLFLTATPFQLGHAELIRVLERFDGIRWQSSHAPKLSRVEFRRTLGELGRVLDKAQASALRLERAWGRLGARHLTRPDGSVMGADEWWNGLDPAADYDPTVAEVLKHVEVTTGAMRAAEEQLAPWVVRHVKSDSLPGAADIPRRKNLPGASIREGGSEHEGLVVSGRALLPFLLAGRAQALLAASEKGRAFFADGLASSFEAYRETRRAKVEIDDDLAISSVDERVSPPELNWYLGQLDRVLPTEADEAFEAHPKILATVERVIQLWKAGEKVLVFCHYRATGRALRRHISRRLGQEIRDMGSLTLRGAPAHEVMTRLDAIGKQFFDTGGSLRRVVDAALAELVQPYVRLTGSERDRIVDVIRRFLRTPSFLARYFPIEAADQPEAFSQALESADQSGVTLRTKIDGFCGFLAERCVDEERTEYLEALDTIQTGSYGGSEVDAVFDAAEHNDGRQAIRLPNVRLANGESRPETRRRLLLGFNTPLFPEILIASSVLAEGVDLHLNCRFVIHHDLCWNPSTLEQRSGRVDRIGSKAEQVKSSINLFLPYVAATQDEKMYRVVRDRERWFQIVMGEKYQTDELSTDKQAQRIDLPESLRDRLSLCLH